MSNYNIIVDTLDILVVTFVIYKFIQIVRQTRAKQLVYGIVILFFVWVVSGWLGMQTLSALLQVVFTQGVLAVVIIFQPEIRSALEHLSRSNLSSLIKGKTSADAMTACINSVCHACQSFQQSKTGALIVFERETKLGDIINTGTVVNADISPEIIGNIFYENTPLHDGAMIIRDGRVAAAGCILPLTNASVNKQLGTRHRAAMGITEVSDAVVVVVSEETGAISVSIGGKIERGFNHITLMELLMTELMPADTGDSEGHTFFKRLFKGGRSK
jgi:diadenylate cyclase